MQSWPVNGPVRDNRLEVSFNSNKTLSSLLFFALVFPAQARVVITPAAPVVPAGDTVKLRANTEVQWSLAPGSAGTIDSDGTYHAPRSVGAKNTVGGCQVLPNDHIFNTRIDELPADQNSPAWMQSIPPSAITYLPSWGINIADKTTPKKRMHFFYTPQYDGLFDLPQWPSLKQENGVFADPLSDLDRHILVVNKDDCIVSEFYKANPRGVNKACPECTAQSGVHYQGMTYELLHGSADAAGLPIIPLTLRLDEITSGTIRHALRVTLSNSLIHASSVWPGSSHASPWGKIPYGTRFRLRKDIDISHHSPTAKVLLKQLKEYGLFLADGGANWEVDISTDVTESPEVMAAFNELHSSITSRDFEVVNETPLMISPDSGRVRPDSGYVKPDDYVIVIAQNAHKPADKTEIPIAIQAPTIGMPNPAIWIQGGVSKKLETWVGGSAAQRTTWKADSSLGSVSPDGVYSAPDVAAPKTGIITASLDSDPAATLPLLVTVIPKGPIRIDVGNATGAPGTPHSHAPDYGPDSKGHMWWREMGGEYAYSVAGDNSYGLPWPKIPDIGLYYTNRYTSGDMLYRFIVPNGNYKITAMYAFPCKGTYQAKYEAPMHFEAQRKLIAKEFDWGAANGHACVTPSIFEMPATVGDNSLEFALRRVTHGDLIPAAGMNAFSIEPDSEPPHLAIDPAHPPDVSAGQTLQLRAIGWFMDDDVTWSLVQGPGSIDQNGIYTAPMTPQAKSQPVVVVATSRSDKSKTARAAFSFKFGELNIAPTEAVISRGLEQHFAVDLSGIPYRNVTWSLSPAIGKIDSNGTYRAPEDLAGF